MATPTLSPGHTPYFGGVARPHLAGGFPARARARRVPAGKAELGRFSASSPHPAVGPALGAGLRGCGSRPAWAGETRAREGGAEESRTSPPQARPPRALQNNERTQLSGLLQLRRGWRRRERARGTATARSQSRGPRCADLEPGLRLVRGLVLYAHVEHPFRGADRLPSVFQTPVERVRSGRGVLPETQRALPTQPRSWPKN